MEASDFQVQREKVHFLVHTAALVLPPYGLGEDDLARWSADLLKVMQALESVTEQALREVNPRWLQGTLVNVQNPARSSSGNVLDLASAEIRSDFGASRWPDKPWIDLRTEEGRELARRAERLVGHRVRYELVTRINLQNGEPMKDETGKVVSRTYLRNISAIEDRSGSSLRPFDPASGEGGFMSNGSISRIDGYC
jgi:hypothetical protein